MKKYLFLMTLAFLCIATHSQVIKGEPDKKENRFFIGAGYSFLSTGMKLSGLTLQSTWYGQDLGSTELNSEEIKEINEFIERSSRINALTFHLGMVLLDKPESDMKINGSLFLGLAGNLTEVKNSNNGDQEYSFNSGFSKPCLGLGFDLSYRLTEHWALSLRPYVIGSMGKANDIQDSINPDPLNFIPDKQDKYQTIYARGSLFAEYTIGHLTIYAGPGFYYCWSKHEYRREYTSIESGEAIVEEITSVIVPVSFIDGSIAIAWKVSGPITLFAHAGLGSDVMIDGGIHYNF